MSVYQKNVFNKLFFNVPKEVYYEVLENPDKGFGYKVELKKKYLTEIQVMTLQFLVKCYDRKVMGKVNLSFNTEAIGDMPQLEAFVEGIKETGSSFKISNTY